MKVLRRWLYGCIGVLWLTGCGSDLLPPDTEVAPGVSKVVDLEGELIKRSLLENKASGVDEQTVVWGQKGYKIVYDSVDIHGNPVKASGYAVVPQGLPEPITDQIGLAVVIDMHGTIFKNSDAPSVYPELGMMPSPSDTSVIFSSLGGFVTLRPDYVGFGQSLSSVHPYVHKRLADDAVALYRAFLEFAKQEGVKLSTQVYITGYSEGGYGALATLQKFELEERLPVMMTAAMAGPYDMNITAFELLSQEQMAVPAFLAYFGYAYGEAYGVALEEIFNPPYANQIPQLFDGSKSKEEINAALTYQTTGEGGLFQSQTVQSFFADSQHWLRRAVLEQSVHAWAPQTPLRLLHCQGDEIIPYMISQKTKDVMQTMGARDVELIPVEVAWAQAGIGDGKRMGHAQCALPAYSIALQLFVGVRQATLGY